MWLLRLAIVVISIIEIVRWSEFLVDLSAYGRSMAGLSSGPLPEPTAWNDLLTAAVWLLVAGPHLCMGVTSLAVLKRKWLRVAYAYALPMLVLMTSVELLTLQTPFLFMALGNIVAGGLWGYAFHQKFLERKT